MKSRRPPWPYEDPPGRPEPSRAAPSLRPRPQRDGHARGGTRRRPRPGRARQPDLLPLKGRGPDGGVAPELPGSSCERRALTAGPAALRSPGDQDGRCSLARVVWLRGWTSPPSLASELAPTRSACVRRCGWGGAWRPTNTTSCQLQQDWGRTWGGARFRSRARPGTEVGRMVGWVW